MDVVEQRFTWKDKCGSQYQDSSRYLLRDSNFKGHDITIAFFLGRKFC